LLVGLPTRPIYYDTGGLHAKISPPCGFGPRSCCHCRRLSPNRRPRRAPESIEQDYAAFLTQAVIDTGIVTVAPDNDGYLVTWDLQKAADLGASRAPSDRTHELPCSFPGPEALWTLRGDHLPR